jgi:hypothetical protein
MHSIQIHGWQELPCGSQEYSDHWAGEACNGFCVYLRTDTPSDPSQPFDISGEADFRTIEAAESYALQMSLHHACEIERY